MNKMLKKSLASALTIAISASMVVAPISVKASALASYSNGTLTVNSDAVYENAKVIVVNYNDDSTLGSVATSEHNIAVGENKLTVDANVNDKIMVWDGWDSMAPVCDSITVTEDTEEPLPEATPIPDNAILFDFGENAEDGYNAVTLDTVFATNKTDDLQYGFHGTDGYGYKIASKVDGIKMQEGQNIELATGKADSVNDADDDWIGVKDGQYPLRFSMAAPNNTYYKVTANLTGLDKTKDATVSLYSEKRHPIVEYATIKAGDTKKVEFTATVQSNYYKNESKTYVDDQLNIVLAGDNAAISSLVVVPVEHQPTVWIYTDSTGCDYDAILPYFPLQNFGGVGQWLTKYLPEGFAMSNQGEGGLNAADNMHWNCAKANIKAGDYVYVEYGHNHKSDGTAGYLAAIPKYYEHAHSVGAYTIYVGPIDRHNSSQYDSSTNTWNSTLKGFSDTAAQYVEDLIASGADDVAFVDLNRPSLDWMQDVCEEIKGMRGKDVYERNATDYYFQGRKGGSIDGTHPNDAGADNFAKLFFDEVNEKVTAGEASDATASEKVQSAVLKSLVTGNREAVPYKVSQEMVDAGNAPNSLYPSVYTPPNLPEFPTVIKNVVVTDGKVEKVVVKKQDAELSMTAYGIIVITVTDENGTEKGKIYATEQIDNTWAAGDFEITKFRYEPEFTIEESDTIDAIVMQALDTENGIVVDEEANIAYSAEYVPSEIEAVLMTDEDGNDGEDFEYYGFVAGDSITSPATGKWQLLGSAEKAAVLATDSVNGFNYADVYGTGAKDASGHNGSFYLSKPLASSISNTGKYEVTMDVRFISGEDASNNRLTIALAYGVSSKNMGGTESISLYTIGKDGTVYAEGKSVGAVTVGEWTTVKYVLDMDMATASVSIAGGTPVTVDVSKYATTSTTVNPASLSHLLFTINRSAFEADFANIHIYKLKSSKLPEKTLSVSSNNETFGTVAISGTDGKSLTTAKNTAVTVTATPNTSCIFNNWLLPDGSVFSTEPEISFRLVDDYSLTAEFSEVKGIEALASLSITADKANVKKSDTASTVTFSVLSAADNLGNEIEYEDSDISWSLVTDADGISLDGKVLTIAPEFAIADNSVETVTVKAVANNIEATFDVAVYSYAYYEEVSDLTDYTGRIETIASKKAIIFNGATNSSASKAVYTFGEQVTLDKATTISMDMVWSGKNTCGQKRTLNFRDSNGTTVFSMYYDWNSLVVNGTSLGGAVSQDAYTTTKIVIDPSTNTITVTANGKEATAVLSSATNISNIEFDSAKSVPGDRWLGMSKIVVEQ